MNDSFYAMQPTIFTIDATATPARITAATPVTRGGAAARKLLDLEGIAPDGAGGFWLASEGRTDRMVAARPLPGEADGEIERERRLPAELLAVERRFGAEGITRVGDRSRHRPPARMGGRRGRPRQARDLRPRNRDWGAVHYPLDAREAAGWVGLSEITAHGDHLYVVERDNQIGAAARIKRLYRVSVDQIEPAELGGTLPVVDKELARDFLPDLTATGGYAVDKIEGFAIDAAGQGYAVTDNDGVDDSNGETLFFRAGSY